MPDVAIGPYTFESKDRVESFHGNQVVYWHWERHLMFYAAVAMPLPPSMPFGAVVDTIFPQIYGYHPDFKKIDWAAVTWTVDGAPLTPDPEASLIENGIGHKSLVRFWTPGLDGIAGTSS